LNGHVVPYEVHPKLRDFQNFLYLLWKHLNLPDPTPVQYDIARFLQDRSNDRIIIEAFRGVGKSWITSAYVLWCLYLEPWINVLVVSASQQRADAFSIFTKKLIHEVPVLAPLRPRKDQRTSNIAFDVGPAEPDHAPSVRAVGVTGSLTGSRADLIVPDDVEVPGNSMTPHLRERLFEIVKEFDSILKPGVGARVCYLGTPQNEESLYNELRTRGYVARIWPSRIPTAVQVTGYGGALAPLVSDRLDEPAGTPVDPARFDDETLLERELSLGRSTYALQFQLDTTLSDAEKYPLRCSDLIVMDLDDKKAPEQLIWGRDRDLEHSLPCVGFRGDRYYRPISVDGSWIPYEGSAMAIDPAGRGKDKTAYAVVKNLNGYLFVLKVATVRSEEGYDDPALKEIVEVAKRYDVTNVIVESNFGDGMFCRLLGRHMYDKKTGHACSIEEIRHSTQKEQRIIDTLEPVMNQHRLVMNTSVVEEDTGNMESVGEERLRNHRLFYQMTRISRDRGALLHDDKLDALAIAVAYWVKVMGQDETTKMSERREELLEEDYKNWENTVFVGGSISVEGDDPTEAFLAN